MDKTAQIKQRILEGASERDIITEFGVSGTYVQKIKNGSRGKTTPWIINGQHYYGGLPDFARDHLKTARHLPPSIPVKSLVEPEKESDEWFRSHMRLQIYEATNKPFTEAEIDKYLELYKQQWYDEKDRLIREQEDKHRKMIRDNATPQGPRDDLDDPEVRLNIQRARTPMFLIDKSRNRHINPEWISLMPIEQVISAYERYGLSEELKQFLEQDLQSEEQEEK